MGFPEEFGINTEYSIEIMDLFYNEEQHKREYAVYYTVKGELPVDKIEAKLSGASITLRNHAIADEAYANTGMAKPYFIIEVSELFLEDTTIKSKLH